MNHKKICPKLYIWKNSRLFIGAERVTFRKYTLAWTQLLVSLEGGIRIKLHDGSDITTRSCMIKAGTVVNEGQINTSNAVISIYYLNPISQDYLILENQMINANKGVCYYHPNEDRLVQQLNYILNASLSPKQVSHLFKEAIIDTRLRHKIVKEFDPRIIQTIQSIRETFSDNLTISHYASNVHLSESRLNKLFKNQIGIPITKYRLQFRLSVGITLLAAGNSVTDAAFGSGFSSSAHFSTCFSALMGILPSTPFLKSPQLNTFIADEAFNAIPHLAASSGDD